MAEAGSAKGDPPPGRPEAPVPDKTNPEVEAGRDLRDGDTQKPPEEYRNPERPANSDPDKPNPEVEFGRDLRGEDPAGGIEPRTGPDLSNLGAMQYISPETFELKRMGGDGDLPGATENIWIKGARTKVLQEPQ
jgi:hypothetical protein